MTIPATGLTTHEVAQRIAQGRVNRVRRSDVIEYFDIVRRNILTLFNALVVPAAIALIALGDYRGGLGVCGMAITNTLLGLVQEIRAKWHLDHLTLLAEARVKVRRDNTISEIPAGDVVWGDHIILNTGDSVVADGEILEANYLEVDEALLTGESDPVPRKVGERVLSGSFCVAGDGVYRADLVGAEAFAQKTASEARSYRYTASPLQHSINRLIEILTAIAVVLSLSYLGLFFLRDNLGADDLVSMVAATITSMVPQGLVLMATLAFVLGAVRMTARGAVVNRLNAVEAMAGIDTLCMDKTGTLTTNQLKLARVVPLADEARARRCLQLFASLSIDRDSKNLTAIRAGVGEATGEVLDQLPFKSQNRYSALRLRAAGEEYTLALGACEALRAFIDEGADWESTWRELLPGGLRLLLLCEARGQGSFAGSLENYRLRPLALVALSDELRPEATQVLEHLAAQGIRFKILSGDNAETVRATVAPLAAGSDAAALAELAQGPVVTGAELEVATNQGELIASRGVFGRVSPWQKVQIVRTLIQQGHRPAMIGDGVNDVLPIKNATLGIAMGDGSRASKTVAGVVLKTNNFALLPELLEEGRKIVRNLRRAGRLFLTKNVYTLLLIIGTLGLFNLAFPFRPQQVTLLNFLTIGIPALLITLDRDRARASRGEFVREVGGFALLAGSVAGLAALVLMLSSAWIWEDETRMQRTVVLTALVFMGFVTLSRALSDGETQDGDHLLRWLPGAGGLIYLVAMYAPPAADFFELEALDVVRWLWILGAVALGWGMLEVWTRFVNRRGAASA